MSAFAVLKVEEFRDTHPTPEQMAASCGQTVGVVDAGCRFTAQDRLKAALRHRCPFRDVRRRQAVASDEVL
jgi:hypothetical protein